MSTAPLTMPEAMALATPEARALYERLDRMCSAPPPVSRPVVAAVSVPVARPVATSKG